MSAYKRGNIKLFFRNDPHLLAYWRFDDAALDESGRGHHGTVIGATQFKGIFNRGYKFTTDNYIEASSSTDLEKQKFTLAFWIKHSGSANIENIWSYEVKGQHNDGRGVHFLKNTSDIFYFLTGDGSGSWIVWTATHGSDPKVTDGKWHFMVWEIDASIAEAFLFFDGHFQKRWTAVAHTISYTDKISGCPPQKRIRFGKYNQLNDPPTCTEGHSFTGELDEIAYFDRLLKPAEISSYYNWATQTIQSNKSKWIIAIISVLFSRAVSVTVSNAAGRLATASRTWTAKRKISATVSNAAGRFASVTSNYITKMKNIITKVFKWDFSTWS